MSGLLWVGFGGALGAMARYGLGLYFTVQTFPWSTLTINIAGSFIIGALWSLFAEQAWFLSWGRLFLVVGVLGGFTTFSAFSLDTLLLLNNGRVVAAITYALASVS
ncbi:MAG: fluoride efflux transporter CrcB, partial [Pseudomonadales bacterium]